MTIDIRDRDRIDHADVVALNFIRADPPFVFRQHFRNGLRSRLVAVLPTGDVRRERQGVMLDGVRVFPRARPVKMLRIFRTRFESLEQALEEARRLRAAERHLTPDFIARSAEFYVEYRHDGRRDILLCGLQEYVAGVALDPWQVEGPADLDLLQRRLRDHGPVPPPEVFRRRVRERVAAFAVRVRRMLAADGLLPDLAGARNLLVTAVPELRLVDINNISRIRWEPPIPLDDRGYPVLDKSIEALDRLERGLLGGPGLAHEAAYRPFFHPARRRQVTELERRFRLRWPGP